MAEETPLFVIHLLGFAAFLWHGLYVLTRGERDRVSRLTGITALVTSCLFLTGGVEEAMHNNPMSERIAFARFDWAFFVLPAALWLHLSLRLNPRAAHAPWRKPVIYTAYGAAVIIIVIGTFTNVIRDYGHDNSLSPVGPAYVLYVIFVLACAGFALANLVQMQVPAGDGVATSESTIGAAPATPSPNGSAGADSVSSGMRASSLEVRMLIFGAVCFLVGVGYFSVLNLTHHDIVSSETPGWALLLIGLGAVGGTVGVQSNLLLGKDLRRDFLYNFTGLVILLVPFLLVTAALIGLDGARARILALVLAGLITVGHTLYDSARLWLDKIFFTPVVQEERAAARAYEEALATQPAGPNPELATRKAFDDAVRRALTHLSDPTKLATSPLLNLQTVAHGVAESGQEDNRLNRAAVLKEILLELLDGLRPNDRAGGVTGDAYRFYNCLYFPYVQGISRRRGPTVLRQLQERRRREGTPRSDAERIVEWLLQVDEDTFYKWQRRGSDTIAAALREREAAAGGVVPDEAPASNPVPILV